MKETKLIRPGLWGVSLLVVFLLSSCLSVGRVVVRLTPTPPSAGQEAGLAGRALLPQPTTAGEPTATPTAVATYAATGTRTPTPTWIPTHTATPTGTARATAAALQATPTSPPGDDEIAHIVIISIDGLRPDALEIADTPALDALRAAGAYTARAQAVVPSVTLINHASMLGGMAPARHGIDWNVYDPSLGKINGPTLFSVAHEAGYSTAMVVGKDKLEHLVLPNSVDQFLYAGFTDLQVTNQAITVIEAGLPDILFIHLPDVDSAGHLTGWMSPGQLLAVQMTDGLVGRIVNALEAGGYRAQTLLLITSDHGGSGTSHGSNSPEDTTIPWLAVGPGVPAGVTLTSQVTAYDTAATALRALELPVPESWDGRPVMEIFN